MTPKVSVVVVTHNHADLIDQAPVLVVRSTQVTEQMLDAGVLCHVGYVIDEQPYVTPTLYWRHGERLYWHGSSASRMLRHLTQGVAACLVQVWGQVSG